MPITLQSLQTKINEALAGRVTASVFLSASGKTLKFIGGRTPLHITIKPTCVGINPSPWFSEILGVNRITNGVYIREVTLTECTRQYNFRRNLHYYGLREYGCERAFALTLKTPQEHAMIIIRSVALDDYSVPFYATITRSSIWFPLPSEWTRVGEPVFVAPRPR